MVLRWIFPLLFFASCSQPTEYERDNPKDPTGASFELPPVSGLTSTRVGRQIQLTWTTPFDRYTIHIERSVNDGPFELRDTLRSTVSSWVDTQVALPDSAVYRYRVFGKYLNQSTDTLTSYRITSSVNLYSIQSEHLDGQSTVRFSPWSVSPPSVAITGDLQTFRLSVDSVAVSMLYENGEVRYLRRLTQQQFTNPRDTMAVKFVVTQHSRGRVIQSWTSKTLDSGYGFNIGLHENVPGRFPSGFPHIVPISGNQAFVFDYTDNNLTVVYDPTLKQMQFISRPTADRIVSTVSVTPGRFLFSTVGGKVASVVLSQGTPTPMNVPEPATILGSYNETGEILYVRARTGQATPASIDRFNTFTQTLLSSFPFESTHPHKILDRPDLNQIWVFHRGLMRLNRTTGAVLQEFESADPINAVLIRNGRAYASFKNNAPYVASYDMQTGSATLHPIPFSYLDALFFSDGVHILYRTSNSIRIYNLIRKKDIAETTDYDVPSPVGFLPIHEASPSQFYFAYVDGYVIRLLKFGQSSFSYYFRSDG